MISSGKNRPNSPAATTTALYPATFDWDVSASIGWARDSVRGSPSRLITVTPRADSAAAYSGSASGAIMPMTAWPARSSPTAAGRVTVRITSAVR